MEPAAVPWHEFAGVATEIADAARRLLEDAPALPGVAFLGTVSRSGSPRIHPFIPAIVGGDLWAFVIESPKQRDLDRTSRFAIHSRLGANDKSFFCAGVAERVDAVDARTGVADRMPYSDIDNRHLLYRFQVSNALWTTWPAPTSPVHRTWTSA